MMTAVSAGAKVRPAKISAASPAWCNARYPPSPRTHAQDSGLPSEPLVVFSLWFLVFAAAVGALGRRGARWLDTGFEVLGRIDNSDVRGCNLMVE